MRQKNFKLYQLLEYPSQRYVLYEGKPIEQMPLLFSKGKEPMFIADYMQKQIDIRDDNFITDYIQKNIVAKGFQSIEEYIYNSLEKQIKTNKNITIKEIIKAHEVNSFEELVQLYTTKLPESIKLDLNDSWSYPSEFGDLWLRHPDGRGKIVRYSPQAIGLLKQIKPTFSTKRKKNIPEKEKKLTLPLDLFETIEGLELTEREILRLDNKAYTYKQARQLKVWEYLAGSKERLTSYTEGLIEKTNEMNHFLSSSSKKKDKQDYLFLNFGKPSTTLIGSLWTIFMSGKTATSCCDLYLEDGILVGMKPELHVKNI